MEGQKVTGHKAIPQSYLRVPEAEELGLAGLIWKIVTGTPSPKLHGRVDKAHGHTAVMGALFGKELREKAEEANQDFEPGPWATLRNDSDSQNRAIRCRDGKTVKAHSALLKEAHGTLNSAVLEHYLDILYGTTNALVISETERQELQALARSEGRDDLATALSTPSTKLARLYPHQPLVLLTDLAKFQHQSSEEERINAAFVAQPAAKLRDDSQSHDLVIRCSDGELGAHGALLTGAGFVLPEEGPLELNYDKATVGRFLDLLYGTKKTMELNEEQLENLRALCLDAGKDWLIDVKPGLVPDLTPYNLSAVLADGTTGNLTIRTLNGTVRAHASLFGLQPGETLDLRPAGQIQQECPLALHAIYTSKQVETSEHKLFSLIDTIPHLPPSARTAARKAARASFEELNPEFQSHWIGRTSSADRVREMLALGIDVAKSAQDGRSLLQVAAAEGATAWIIGLLNAGADPRATSKQEGKSPLELLAGAKVAELHAFDALLEQENLKQPDFALFKASLEAAIKSGNSAIVARLHEVLPEKTIARLYREIDVFENAHDPKTRQTKLHTLVEKRDLQEVRDCLQLGYSVNWQDAKGETPIHLAARSGNREVLALLLKRQENPKLYLENLDGKTAAQVAEEAGHPEIAKKLTSQVKTVPLKMNIPASTLRKEIPDNEKVILKDSEGNEYPVHQALFKGSLADAFEAGDTVPLVQFGKEAIGLFLDIAYDTHHTYIFSPRLLHEVHHLADFLGIEGIANALEPHLEELGDREDGYPNIAVGIPLGLLTPNLEGTEAERRLLGNAIPEELRFPSTMKLLRQVLYTGQLANFSYTELGRLSAVSQFLPEVAKDCLLPDLHQVWDRLPHASPLLMAMSEGREEVVLPLIKFETKIDRADPDTSLTALSIAADRGRTDWIEALLEKGADPSRAPQGGLHPIFYAAFRGNFDAFMALLPKSVPKENPGSFLQQCIHNASHGGSREIVMALRKKYPLEQLYSDEKQGYDVAHELFEDPEQLQNVTIVNLHDPQTLDSLLHAAVREGNREAFVALAERGYDLNWENLKGEKPIDLADEAFAHFIKWWQLERARS